MRGGLWSPVSSRQSRSSIKLFERSCGPHPLAVPLVTLACLSDVVQDADGGKRIAGAISRASLLAVSGEVRGRFAEKGDQFAIGHVANRTAQEDQVVSPFSPGIVAEAGSSEGGLFL